MNDDTTPNDPTPNDPGQSTAEYALVMLGAALIALVLISWATGGGGGRIAGLLDHIFDSIEGRLP